MELNTIEDIQKYFPDDDTARKYLFELRWNGRAVCPYCNNDKAYFIEKGKRFKCANKECYKKFSVTVKTVLEATHINLNIWFGMIFMFSKSRGRCSSYDVVNEFKIAHKNEFFVRERLDFAWKYVNRDGKNNKELFDEMLRCMISAYPHFNEYKHSEYYANPFHISTIDNIGDAKQFNLLLRYTNYYINVYCRWIWIDFAKAGDILSEAFLWMSENNIKEYNAESIIKIIQQTVNRMWDKFLSESPKYNEYKKRVIKRKKENDIINMTDRYVVELIKKNKKYSHLNRQDIKKDTQLIKQFRNSLINKRKKSNRNYEFISHFS